MPEELWQRSINNACICLKWLTIDIYVFYTHIYYIHHVLKLVAALLQTHLI